MQKNSQKDFKSQREWMSQKTQNLSETKVSHTNESTQTVGACTVLAKFQVRQSPSPEWRKSARFLRITMKIFKIAILKNRK